MTAIPAVQPTSPGKEFLQPLPFNVDEDSTLYKVLACIPIVGTITSAIMEYSLGVKALSCKERPRQIELLKTANAYKAMGIVRTVAIIALTVAGLAAGILGKAVAIVVLVLNAISIMGYAKQIIDNKAEIKKLSLS